MYQRVVVAVAIMCCSMGGSAGDSTEAEAAVDQVLNSLHRAASEADGELYFSLFADDAVFMGTDATERWSVEGLKAFAEPYFSQGRGWSYSMRERNIFLSSSGRMAWFDEVVWNETFGTCRGTGVLTLNDGGWKIVQYSLTILIPNDLAIGCAEEIKEYENQALDAEKH